MTSWSYSMYSTAIQCLQKYKLIYIDQVVPEAPLSGDLAFGSALHSSLNSIIKGEDGEQIFEIYWDSYQGKELEYGRFKWKELREIGLNFCSKFSRLHASKYKMEMAEKRLYSEYKGVKLEGTPDFLGSYNGRISLRDFKTSGYNYAKEKAHVALQLNLYAYLSLSTGETKSIDTLGYTVFNKGSGSIQDLTWDFDEAIMYSMLDDLVAYCATFDNRQSFPKNPNACVQGTMKCPFFEQCWSKK